MNSLNESIITKIAVVVPRAGVSRRGWWGARVGGGKVGRGVVGIPLVENKTVSWFLGFRVSYFLVSQFLGFLVSKVYQISISCSLIP